MCTAVSFENGNHYFGRTLDWVCSYGEKIVIVPRNFLFSLRNIGDFSKHYAIIGTAVVADDTPLFFDAVNEKGLSVAALNFPQNAFYCKVGCGVHKVASFEFIPWVLGQCSDVAQARSLVEKTVITDTAFNEKMPATALHWMFADKDGSITVEQTEKGMQVYENPVGVLTNNPTFDYHLNNLSNYMALSSVAPENNFSKDIKLSPYSYGMGALGLPGYYSSASRFIKAAFLKLNAAFDEKDSVNEFFKILDAVSMPKGAVKTDDGYEYTVYSSCCDTKRGIYYYKTYENSAINAIDMHRCDLDGNTIFEYDFLRESKITVGN